LRSSTPAQLRSALAFLPATTAERSRMVEAALRSGGGDLLRAEIGNWIVERLVPVETLVPETYLKWHAPVRDAMLYVISHFSHARLAPKIVEQIELPPDTPPEIRLLRLIAKVPGLQKLGQIVSRNRHLRPALREALSELENGIQDVNAQDMRALIQEELGSRLETCAVEIEPALLSEASVSAVLRFTWWNPDLQEREKGVFKVLKPHIPACFAEDMELLQRLAEYFGARHGEYGFAAHVLPETFTKVRRLLEHEVDFVREQKTLQQACSLYRSIAGVRVPRLIRPLCSPRVTAITEEQGVKVTTAAHHMPAWRRGRVAGQLIEALIAAPMLAADAEAMFHADPHPGNLLYNSNTGELVILDWALTERLSRSQRRHLTLLFFMVGLRDRVGAANQVCALSQRMIRRDSRQAHMIRDCVADFLDRLPLTRIPGAVDAMLLLEELAVKGVRFPAPLIMFSKALFTLDAILNSIGGSDAFRNFILARHLARRWLANRAAFGSPLTFQDLLGIQCSAAFCGGRMWVHGEQALLNRLLPRTSNQHSAVSTQPKPETALSNQHSALSQT
jgi:ubiquinone biosynthesis protein